MKMDEIVTVGGDFKRELKKYLDKRDGKKLTRKQIKGMN